LAALGVSRPVHVFHQRALEAAASTASRYAVQTWPLGVPREASVTAPAWVLAATAFRPDVMLFMLQSTAAWFVNTCSDGACATHHAPFFFLDVSNALSVGSCRSHFAQCCLLA
jgi:hypothetical protein